VNNQQCLFRLKRYLRDDIDITYVHFQLVALGFATGIADVVSYKDFSVFASNQTGNTVVLAVRILGVSMVVFSSIVASLFGFLVASFISGQLSHRIGNHRRWWVTLNNLFQTVLIFVVVGLISTRVILTKDNNAYILILLLAVSYGCQVTMAKQLSCPEIPTAMLTSPFIDFLIDPSLFKRHNLPRNRRLFYIIFFIIGIIVGSIAYIKVSSEFTLGIAGVVKCLVTLAFFFNPKVHHSPLPPTE
jgi:uncharacterized membrane protein YoaK (UPF0700 family)